MASITITIYDKGGKAYYKVGRDSTYNSNASFTKAEQAAVGFISLIASHLPSEEPEAPVEAAKPPLLITHTENNVIHADFSKERKTAAQKWKEKLKCSTHSTPSQD